MERNSMVLIYYVNCLEVDRCNALFFFEVLRFQVKIMSSLRAETFIQFEASEFLLPTLCSRRIRTFYTILTLGEKFSISPA